MVIRAIAAAVGVVTLAAAAVAWHFRPGGTRLTPIPPPPAHLSALVDWAMTHETLVIVTWDESDEAVDSHIPTELVEGPDSASRNQELTAITSIKPLNPAKSAALHV